MKNQGISLISLIITIIVIIILAAIVIFTGLGTPDSANFAHFCQDVDNVQSAVLNAYSELKVAHATSNQTRSDEQIYMEIALGAPIEGSSDESESNKALVSQYSAMTIATVPTAAATSSVATADKNCQNIVMSNTTTGETKSKLLKINLPKVRESRDAWYITKQGQVFNATGYYYKSDTGDATYYTANAKTTGKKAATSGTYASRAEKIATALNTGDDTSNINVGD